LINLNNVDLTVRTNNYRVVQYWQYFWLVFFITIKPPSNDTLERGIRENLVSLFGRGTNMSLVVYIEGLLFQTSRWFG